MREIEFKGKVSSEILLGNAKPDGTWVYGFYRDRVGCPTISEFDFGYGNYIDYEIDRNTLCQYIGLKDKNGTKIFEGDVILSQEFRNKPFSKNHKRKRLVGVVEYYERKHSNGQGYDCGYNVKFVNEDEQSYYNCGSWSDFYDCEVIGNIYDNPELLTQDEM